MQTLGFGSRISAALKSERHLFAAYRKDHPHMWICLTSEALLVVLLIVGGFAISRTISPTLDSILLERAGGKMMSAVELIDNVHKNGRTIYWLRAQSNVRYSMILNRPGVTILNIYSKGFTMLPTNQNKTVIETFVSEAAEGIIPLESGDISQVSVFSSGRTIEYDTSLMNEVEIEFESVPEVVRIHYPTKQSVESMIRDAKSVKLVW